MGDGFRAVRTCTYGTSFRGVAVPFNERLHVGLVCRRIMPGKVAAAIMEKVGVLDTRERIVFDDHGRSCNTVINPRGRVN